MRQFAIAIMSVFTLLLGLDAVAQSSQTRQINIPMYDQIYHGQSVIPLKRLIQREYPNINLQNWELTKVRVVAKSQHGRGQASLVVGQWESYRERINGHPGDWHWDAPRSFDHLTLHNDSRRRAGRGRWQILLQGNIKVRRLMITGRRVRGGGGDGRGRVTELRCASRNGQYKECFAGGEILRATLVDQLSQRRCVEGRNWGHRRRVLWVDNGCKGLFRVRILSERGRGLHEVSLPND